MLPLSPKTSFNHDFEKLAQIKNIGLPLGMVWEQATAP